MEKSENCRIFAPRNICTMTKEFNIFPPDYMDGLLEYPRKVTFPCKNGKPYMYQFQGGYYSFDKDGKYNGYHLYVKDYQGNVRLVVNGETDSIEQVNHYYPYGALMGDISTSQDFQKYKYSGKELDRKFGLDLYDFHARQQDPLLGRFTSIDNHAEMYCDMSPYVYCAGDPVNFIDPTGEDFYYVDDNGDIFLALVTDDDYDRLYSSDGSFINVEDRGVLPELSGLSYTYSGCNLENLFYFLADNTKVEWSLSWMNDGYYDLRTDHKIDSVSAPSVFDYRGTIHSHPGDWNYEGTRGASYTYGPIKVIKNGKEELVYSGGDMEFIRQQTDSYQKRYGESAPFPNHYVYHVKSGNIYKYTRCNPSIFYTRRKK